MCTQAPPPPPVHPEFFLPLHDLSRVVLDLHAKFQLCILKTVRMHRDRQTKTDRQTDRQTILFIDILAISTRCFAD